jgi:hypothetical protein
MESFVSGSGQQEEALNRLRRTAEEEGIDLALVEDG